MEIHESCSIKILLAFQIEILFCLVRADIQTNNFYVMKANDASSASIQSYRIGVTRSAMNGVAMCSMESQCRGVWVEPIEARKVRCHFVDSSLNQTEPRKYDFWHKVGEIPSIVQIIWDRVYCSKEESILTLTT